MTDIEENQDTVLVAEYTLGLMEPHEAKAFAERMEQDADLRAEYIRWTEHFANLSESIEEVAPPSQLKADIHTRIFGKSEEPTPSLFGGFNLRWLSGLALACVVGVLVFVSMPEKFTPTYTAQLISEDQTLKFTAMYDQKKQSLRVSSLLGTPAVGRDFELWAIVGDNAPVSLGVITPLIDNDVQIPAELADTLSGATLAMSDEPQGGSPTGSPTGAVLVAAPIQAI